jgi:hypothetical protein
MKLNLANNLTVKLEISADQLEQLISEAALTDVPGYSKADVSFTVSRTCNPYDETTGYKLEKVTVSLSNPT